MAIKFSGNVLCDIQEKLNNLENFYLGPKNGKVKFFVQKKRKNPDFRNRGSKDQKKDKKQAKFKKLRHSSFLKCFQVLILKIPTFIVKYPNPCIHLKSIFYYLESFRDGALKSAIPCNHM